MNLMQQVTDSVTDITNFFFRDLLKAESFLRVIMNGLIVSLVFAWLVFPLLRKVPFVKMVIP
jgi:hypothetical protein